MQSFTTIPSYTSFTSDRSITSLPPLPTDDHHLQREREMTIMLQAYQSRLNEYQKQTSFPNYNNPHVCTDTTGCLSPLGRGLTNDLAFASSEDVTLFQSNTDFTEGVVRIKLELQKCRGHLRSLREKESTIRQTLLDLDSLQQDMMRIFSLFHSMLGTRLCDNLDAQINSMNESRRIHESQLRDVVQEIQNVQDRITTLWGSIRTCNDGLLTNDEVGDGGTSGEHMTRDISCHICSEKAVDTCLNPCGHTFCSQCLRSSHGNCFTCRSRIDTMVKLFF